MKRFLPFLRIVAVVFVVVAALLLCNRAENTLQYSVTVSDDGNGTAEATLTADTATPVEAAVSGTEITLTATPAAEYMFNKWTVVSGDVELSDEAANPATFTTPAGDVEVMAEFVFRNGFDFITDPTFKAYCEQFDTNTDGILSYQEAGEVTEIDVSNGSPQIESLAGIEIFTNMTYLDCYDNNISALDLSKNTALTYLNCGDNNLSALDVSNLAALTYLDCTTNNLSDLNLDNLAALTVLYCGFNNLSALDVSNLTALTTLYCYNNNLSTLDVSNNAALTCLACNNNEIATINLENNEALGTLCCYNNNLSALDVSNNEALGTLYCYNNNLSDLDLSNSAVLSEVYCMNTGLSAAAMRDMFASLPSRQGMLSGVLSCARNPGSAEITAEDVKVAEDKNWVVNN